MRGPLVLIGLAASPWTLQARWALLHHGIAHSFEPYLPMLGEPLLRARLGFPRGPVSVPVLLGQDDALRDSVAIARYADVQGRGAPLFARELDEPMRRWLKQLDLARAAGRALVGAKTLESDAALDDGIPERWPELVRRASLPVARVAMRYLLSKHGAQHVDTEACRSVLREALLSARDTYARRPYVLGERFTFADMAVVSTLQFVDPTPLLFRIGDGISRAFTDEALKHELAPLLAARDRIVRTHFSPSSSRSAARSSP